MEEGHRVTSPKSSEGSLEGLAAAAERPQTVQSLLFASLWWKPLNQPFVTSPRAAARLAFDSPGLTPACGNTLQLPHCGPLPTRITS